ncbi:PcfJ domain-containing protein [Brevibacillus laterosporus]|uniref:PcfJ domain-containing protein n=1 Tax=Brevibacillus laterosporus TaxID=1465 RepID=UPI003D196F9C
MELKDYKVGVVYGSYGKDKNIVCSCGRKSVIDRNDPRVCPCGNTNVIDIGFYSTNRRIIDGIYTCLEKNDKAFRLHKQEVNISYKSDMRELKVKVGHIYVLTYDRVARTISLTKNSESIHVNEKSLNQFFKAIMNERDIINYFTTERTKELYDFAFDVLGAIDNERTNKLGRALTRLWGVPKLELFSLAGFSHNLRNIYRHREWMHSPETQPHKVLNIPKYMLSYLRELDFSKNTISILRKLDNHLGGNNMRTLLQITKEESNIDALLYVSDIFIELHNEYGYKDIRKLALYLTREVKLQQGIDSPNTAAILLRDYAKMQKSINNIIREKYPDSLKKVHDITQMNYRAKVDERKQKAFKEVVDEEEYSSLSYRKKTFTIVTPQDSKDIISEGSSLSHCVASYVDDVIRKKCKILFLRSTVEMDKPLVTIEIRDNNIRQVRGAFNRKATKAEMSFVEEWSEYKNLKVSCY